jgi:hypothetical protein
MKRIGFTFACHVRHRTRASIILHFLSTFLPFSHPLPSALDRTPNSCRYKGWNSLCFLFEEIYPLTEHTPPVSALLNLDCVRRIERHSGFTFINFFGLDTLSNRVFSRILYIDVYLAKVTFNLTFTLTSTS